MKKLIIASCLSFFMCIIVNANNEPQIITENFKVEPIAKADLSNLKKMSKNEMNNNGIIGTLGEYKVVNGEKAKEDIAFVIQELNDNYVIKNEIIVRCAKNYECVPKEFETEKLGVDYYLLKVSDYNEWKNVKDTLENTKGVIELGLSYDYGINPEPM